MILEVIRMGAAAAAHEGYGVNAQLDAMREAGLIEDGDAVPALRAVREPTTHDATARGEFDLDLPVLVVSVETAATWEGEVGQNTRQSDTVTLLFLYVAPSGESAKAVREALYTTRAIVRTIRAWMSNANAADRVRNGVAVRVCHEIAGGEVPTDPESQTGVIRAAVAATLQVVDSQP